MRDEAHDQRCPAPVFEDNGFFTAIFYPNPEVRAQAGTGQELGAAQVTGQVTGQVTIEVLKMIEIMLEEMSRTEIQMALSLKGRANFEDRYLKPALEQGLVEMTIPEKPRSSKQRYRLTQKGRTMLESGGRTRMSEG